MRSFVTDGLICLEDDYKFVYKIAKIEYEEWENGQFVYRFNPFYSVIDMLPSYLFQGIPGLDLSLRRACYERRNTVPVFISERTPGENREDVWQLLEENGMNALNRLEWLIRTNRRYSGDRFFVERFEKEYVTATPQSMFDLVPRSDLLIGKLLDIICFGDYLHTKELDIDDHNRAELYRFLMPIYIDSYERKRKKRIAGIVEAKRAGTYQGRSEIRIDPLYFERIADAYRRHELTASEAAAKLGISTSTFFRRLQRI